MHLTIRIKKWPNFYYFVQNLSEWHFSTVPQQNKNWEKEGGKLTKEEEEALASFAVVHKRYSFGTKRPLFAPFLIHDQPLDKLKTWLTSREHHSISKCFAMLERRFESIYQKDIPALQQWKDILTQKTKPDFFHTTEVTAILSKLYRRRARGMKDVIVYPVISGKARLLNGTAYSDQLTVVLPVSRVPTEKQNDVISILWHELIHVHFDRAWYIPFLFRNLPDIEAVQKINEVTAAALFPGGILAQRFFHVSRGDLYHGLMKRGQEQAVLALMTDYLHKDRKLDNEFVSSVRHILGQDIRSFQKAVKRHSP